MGRKPSLKRLFALQEFLLTFSSIDRVIHLPNKPDKLENDAEHSYSLAMMAWFLVQYFPQLDRDKALRLALAHDIVEVYAGDTFFYAHESLLATKSQREEDAYQKIVKQWPDFPELSQCIHEYKDLQTAESRFVYALDKIMPIFVVYMGKGYTWKQENITLQMLHSKKRDKVALSPEINPYYEKLLQLLTKSPHYFSGKASKPD